MDIQAYFEYVDISTYDLDAFNRIYSVKQPYRKALNTYLNTIQIVNKTLLDLKLPGATLITGNV